MMSALAAVVAVAKAAIQLIDTSQLRRDRTVLPRVGDPFALGEALGTDIQVLSIMRVPQPGCSLVT